MDFRRLQVGSPGGLGGADAQSLSFFLWGGLLEGAREESQRGGEGLRSWQVKVAAKIKTLTLP